MEDEDEEKKIREGTINHQLHQLPAQSLLKKFVPLRHQLLHHFLFAYNHHHHQIRHQ
jgi:hypothetical protein